LLVRPPTHAQRKAAGKHIHGAHRAGFGPLEEQLRAPLEQLDCSPSQLGPIVSVDESKWQTRRASGLEGALSKGLALGVSPGPMRQMRASSGEVGRPASSGQRQSNFHKVYLRTVFCKLYSADCMLQSVCSTLCAADCVPRRASCACWRAASCCSLGAKLALKLREQRSQARALSTPSTLKAVSNACARGQRAARKLATWPILGPRSARFGPTSRQDNELGPPALPER